MEYSPHIAIKILNWFHELVFVKFQFFTHCDGAHSDGQFLLLICQSIWFLSVKRDPIHSSRFRNCVVVIFKSIDRDPFNRADIISVVYLVFIINHLETIRVDINYIIIYFYLRGIWYKYKYIASVFREKLMQW